MLGLGGAALVGACAKGSTSVDEADDGGARSATTVGSGGTGGDSVGPSVGSGSGGNSAGPGTGGGAAGGNATNGAGSNTGAGGNATNGAGGAPTTGSGGNGSTSNGAGGAANCTQILLDVGFEAGAPNATWTESSTNLASPLCTVATCGQGGGTGPRTGTWWFWGGGVPAPTIFSSIQEIASVEQTVTIPAGTASLDYYIEIPSCDTAIFDYFIVAVDQTNIYQTDSGAENAAGNCVAGYQLRSLNLDAFADGAPHAIMFYVDQLHDGLLSSGVTNYFVDDVALTACN